MHVEPLLSRRARADLDEIWDYTAEQWGSRQAEDYIRTIWQACRDVADGAAIGRSADEIRPGYWRFTVGAHVLFYRRLDQDAHVEIVRILHRRMDLPRHL
jgi:toxin ParE1/3/4